MYQALYRKYRPRCFGDVAGQEHVTETLRCQITGNRLSHAYLFVGTRGTGKTTCAKILSRAVNCQDPVDGEPCNKCASCLGIENGSILDVLELDAASNNGVDNVRALREEAIYSPASVKRRVYIIDEVHMLSNAAFNALLKILEEPPEHLIFILATTELHKVPATILSRCQRFSFKRLSSVAIAARLKQVAKSEGLTLTADAAEKLAALADGSMRDGISLLDQCASDMTVDLQRVLDTIGLAGQQELLRLAVAAADGDTTGALGILDSLYNDGRDMASLLNEISALMRDILVFKLSPDSPLLSGGFSRKELSILSKKLTPERLFSCLEIVRDAAYGLSRGGSVKLSVEMCLIRMCDERLSDDAATVLARVAKLEQSEIWKAGAAGLVNSAGAVESEPDRTDRALASEPDRADRALASEPNLADRALASEPNLADRALDLKSAIPDSTHSAPAAPSSSSPVSPLSATDNTSFWDEILSELKNEAAVYALLGDSTSVQAELKEGLLTIRATNPFTANTIESKMFSGPLKAAAGKVLGREVILRVEISDGNNDKSKREKLDSLSMFDIIQFEQ